MYTGTNIEFIPTTIPDNILKPNKEINYLFKFSNKDTIPRVSIIKNDYLLLYYSIKHPHKRAPIIADKGPTNYIQKYYSEVI